MKKLSLFLFIIVLLGFTGPSLAFESSPNIEPLARPATWWTNLTVGRGVQSTSRITSNSEIGALFSFNGAFSDKIFGTLYSHHVGDYADNETFDAGIMAGYKHKMKKGYYSISSGASYYSKRSSENGYHNYYYYGSKVVDITEGVGVPLQIQAFWTPFKHVGFGITTHGIFGKVNYASLTLGMQVYS